MLRGIRQVLPLVIVVLTVFAGASYAQNQPVITGVIVDGDGKPLQETIELTRSSEQVAVTSAKSDEKGQFKITASEPDYYLLRVNRKELLTKRVFLALEKPVEVKLELRVQNGDVEPVFADKNSDIAKYAAIHLQGRRAQSELLAATTPDKPDANKRRAEFSKAVTELHAPAIAKALETEKDPVQRAGLMFRYLLLRTLAGGSPTSADEYNLAREVITEIPPNSPLWAIAPGLIRSAQRFAGPTGQEYLEKVLSTHKDARLKGSLLFEDFRMAKAFGNAADAKRLHARLVNELGHTEYGKMAKEISPESAIEVGKPVPEFSLVSLDDSKKTLTPESLKGKVYLIDFWATWCGPCVGEMDHLHKAYEKYKGKNFEIVSLSFDGSVEEIKKFRGNKWKMPWLHAFVEGGFESNLARKFDVFGIPKPILVDSTGKIIATEGSLRGEQLDKTLEKVLNEVK